MSALQHTVFHPQHLQLNAKMVPFAGYDMPLHYAAGILQEHQQVRQSCGVFDVSHMGVCLLSGPDAAKNLSTLTPTEFSSKANLTCTYTLLTNPQGGIIDDLIVTRLGPEEFLLVINAATKTTDLAWLKSQLKGQVVLQVNKSPALLAIQGPRAAEVLQQSLLSHEPLASLKFMRARQVKVMGYDCVLTRSGYTGEDGFELLGPPEPRVCHALWEQLLSQPGVLPCGLGCRDSLRLEAGYPLYGHDLNAHTTPVEAGLSWVITPNHQGYLGADIITPQLKHGAALKRVGIKLLAPGIAREGASLHSQSGEKIGQLCSGGFSPTLKLSIGQAYLPHPYHQPGSTIFVAIRGQQLPAEVTPLSFIKKGK